MPLLLGLLPIFQALFRIASGAVVGLLIYMLASQFLMPAVGNLFSSITSESSSLSSASSGFFSLISFFQIPHLISLIVAAYSAGFSFKLTKLLLTAKAQKVGS